MGAPLRRLAEGHPDELAWSCSPVGGLPFPAPLIEAFALILSYQSRFDLTMVRGCGMNATNDLAGPNSACFCCWRFDELAAVYQVLLPGFTQ